MTHGENQARAGSGGGIEIVRMSAELDLTTSEGVRDPLVLTGNPRNKPAARFAAPIPTSSSWPRSQAPL
jgi:hypothetical protein